jgi:hypothetical protein
MRTEVVDALHLALMRTDLFATSKNAADQAFNIEPQRSDAEELAQEIDSQGYEIRRKS